MRWLLTILIAVFFWTGWSAGQQLVAPSMGSSISVAEWQPVNMATLDQDRLVSESQWQRKKPKQLWWPLVRSLGSAKSLAGGLSISPISGEYRYRGLAIGKKPMVSYPLPLPNPVDWMLHLPQQQSRLNGWKESNILYTPKIMDVAANGVAASRVEVVAAC